MKKRLNLFVLFALAIFGLRAQYVAPSEGIFQIINVGYNAALMEDFLGHKLQCTATIGDNDDYEQLWVLKKSASGYSLQNVFTGTYIQTGNTGTEVSYWTGATPKTFNIVKASNENAYNIWDSTLGSQGLHSKGANGSVVRWVDCDPSQWRFVKVDLTEENIAEARAEYERLTGGDKLDGYQAVLDEVFADKACTVLNDKYAAMSAEEIRTALAEKLPETLVAMAVKTRTGEWAEPNEKTNKPGWDSDYAKKFRVQMIEPHSIAGEITEWIGHQGHTNMDNPTGLYANKREELYIMVSDSIEEGAELWATWIVGHSKMSNYNNGYPNGVRLKQGLNIVPFGSDGSALYINYLVHTYDKGARKFAHKLSDYKDLKIRVEGGYINGYYNVAGDALYTPDNDDDWVYYEERANLENITILGRYEVLQFELNDVVDHWDEKEEKYWSHRGLAALFPEELPTEMPNSPAFTAPNQRINAIVEAWDRIFLAEKMSLGVASKADVDSMNKLFPRLDGNWENPAEIYNYDDALFAFCDSIKDRDGDYGEYYNHRGVAFGTRTGYMYGSWDHSGYHINTTPSILTEIATEAGPTWGPAHEIGHQHQALYTLNGEMEVTNNTFANIAAWYMGMGTSRVNGTEGNLAHVYDNFKSGGYLLSNNIWVLTQRYYRLWLYYHRAGNNTQFFPRLFELIRKKPMERSYGSDSEMRPNDKGVMENVGFQLTNGYRSYLHFYQLCCEAAQEDLTEFFRAYGCFVPVDGVFQGDYTNSKYYTTQEEIDKAIAEVKAKNYPINNKVLFINDCTPDTTYSHDGKTPREFWDGDVTKNGKNGEVGCYVDYLKGTPITEKYVYTLDDFKLTIEGGKGAVGFAIYNKEGEIQAFSNNHSFSINKDVKTMLRSGEATLYAVAATTKDVPVVNSILLSSPEKQLEQLQAAQYVATKYLTRKDETGTKVGYLNPDSIADYEALVAEVEKVLALPVAAENNYGEWYLKLDSANAYIENNSAVRVNLTPNNFYAISNSINYLTNGNAGLRAIANNEETLPEKMQWRFVKAEVEGTYHIQLRESGKYISSIASNRPKAEVTDIKEAMTFSVASADTPGEMYIQANSDEKQRLYNSSGTVYVGYQTGSNARWTIQLIDNLIALPDASTDELITLYYLLRDENGEYAYSYMPKSSDKGRIATGMSDDPDDYNYCFYFKQGTQEGKYTIYSCGTGKAVTKEGNKLYIDKDAEVVPEFSIAPDKKGQTLTISDEAGNWGMKMGEATELIEVSAEGRTAWKLQRIRTVSPVLTSLTINTPDKETLLVGDSIALTVETAPMFAVNHSVTWTSSDENIATVDANGKVKAISDGTVTITVIANDGSGLTDKCEFTIKKNLLTSLTITKKTAKLKEGESVTLNVRTRPETAPDHSVTWTSSDESIATVDENGTVTAIAAGKATITATANDGSGLTATCEVTVESESGIFTVDAATLSVQGRNGAIIIEGLAKGTVVSIYDVTGRLITTFTTADSTAIIEAGLVKKGTAIVKIGGHSIKLSL